MDRPADDQASRRVWLGVVVDILLTALLLVLGIDPVFDVVSKYRSQSAFVLGLTHMIMVPMAMLTVLIKADEYGFFKGRPGWMQQAVDLTFLLFFIFGWLAPILVFAQRVSVPSWLIGGCILAHVAPIVAAVGLAIVGKGQWMDRLAFAAARHKNVWAAVYAAYLGGIEVFLMLARTERRGLAGMALLVWLGAYLPTRLLLAKLTGLRGPERWTFVASNLHLLARMLLAGAGA